MSLFPQLLGEYDSLRKEHEAVKVGHLLSGVLLTEMFYVMSDLFHWTSSLRLQNRLVSAENKLVDANDHISELKR